MRADTAAGRIRALPPAVADSIAAGEVVERPASVVKELCENALDAGCRRIEVDVSGAGLTRLRVLDDGCGIEPEDLRLAVARHATSKIDGVADLARIRTLGFRGEALASIAAVSDLRLTSRVPGRSAAATIRVRAGEVLESGVTAAAAGTCVEVSDLFASTPARLRFLRSPRSETGGIVRAVADAALSRPDVAAVCRTDGRVALRSPGSGALLDAARAVLGPEAARSLLPVEPDGPIAVGGLISSPRTHRAARGGLVLLVNGRRIHHRALAFAVEEAYRGLIPSDRHPYGVLTITLDPEEVDVNVHPAKREVRFRDEGRVFTAVQRACWSALQRVGPGAAVELRAGSRGALTLGETPPGWRPAWPSGAPPRRPAGEHLAAALALQMPPGASAQQPLGPADGTLGEPPSTPAPGALGQPPLAPSLRALGQVGGEWMVATSGDDVVLVDPHAAHEKVLYAPLVAAGQPVAEQLLLVPALVECDPARLELLERHGDDLAACGVRLEPFGPATVRCLAVPPDAAGRDVPSLIADLLDILAEEGGGLGERRHRLAATVACHSAVRFGDVLDRDEQQRLLDRLPRTPGWTACPHGRPTVLILDRATLRRAFRRPPD